MGNILNVRRKDHIQLKDFFFIKVPSIDANKIIPNLHNMNLIEKTFKIQQHNEMVYIPLKKSEQNIELIHELIEKEKYNIEVCGLNEIEELNLLKIRELPPKKLKDSLKNQIPPELSDLLPSSYDIIGTVAIIDLSRPELKPLLQYGKLIGETIRKNIPAIKTVYAKIGEVEGVKRLRSLKLLSGNDISLTLYKENNCKFLVDVKKCFFTPRLSYERNRIATMKTPFTHSGIVWDVFCGVGPFIIQIAKKQKKGHFVGTDINELAIELAKKNIKLSKVENKDLTIQFYRIDVREIWSRPDFSFLKRKVSRIIMNLPKHNLDFIDVIKPAIQESGTLLHIYQFNAKEKLIEEATERLKSALEKNKIKLKRIVGVRRVKPYNPALDMSCIDAIIEPESN